MTYAYSSASIRLLLVRSDHRVVPHSVCLIADEIKVHDKKALLFYGPHNYCAFLFLTICMDTTKEQNSEMRVYELGYLLLPTLGEEHVPAEVTALKDIIGKSGGVFVAEDFPRFIELAYRMERTIANRKEKFTHAYFGWTKFEMNPEAADALDKELVRNEKLVRHIMFRTVRENTIASRKPFRSESRKKVDDAEPKVEINKEEVDAQIDALVVE